MKIAPLLESINLPELYSRLLALEIRSDLCSFVDNLSTKPTAIPELLFRPRQRVLVAKPLVSEFGTYR
jgi:hypothetical protein